MNKKLQKGQLSLMTAVVGAAGMIIASGLTAWATATNRVNMVDAKVDVVTERENNHYDEVQKSLVRIEEKLDKAVDKKDGISTGPTITTR